MTLSEAVKAKLDFFNCEYSEDFLNSIFITEGLEAEVTLSPSNKELLDKALYCVIPEILVKPSISEGGYSVKFDKDAIVKYYNLLCQKNGFENELNSGTINDVSYLW